MWKLKIAEGGSLWLQTTNGHFPYQFWEFDPNVAISEGELAAIDETCENFRINRFEKKHSGRREDGGGVRGGEGEREKKKRLTALEEVIGAGTGAGGGSGLGWERKKKKKGREFFGSFVCFGYFEVCRLKILINFLEFL
ncbi:unnamed protein product [Coffea canephora]|uniref:Uncharacterized protein n=1 Tax=Coffea canephora TaxID=49390 RepID=A0A068UGR5_COFCA|nr:unnamed protein product [Coffea canephora]